ncbi:MAG: hypothetical protein LBM75_06220 [Myxococcales bacterium]|jgi:flotillin|nr:hypothetical protein [Myxococcales bacterium]
MQMQLEGMELIVALIIVAFILFFGGGLAILGRYRRCPSDKVMVIYGRTGTSRDGSARASKCIHGGAAFVWPVFQDYRYLDLTPFSINIDLKNALSRQNIRIDVPSRFTVGISTEPGIMQNAAERLLGLQLTEVQNLAGDIIFGQLRLIIATMDIEEINTNRDKFLAAVSENVESELKKIGLRLINVNVTDITDGSGYIAALGKEAAAKAINDAKRTVAERNRDGNMGEALAQTQESVAIAEREQEMRIGVAEANARALQGEKESEKEQRIAIANADALAVQGEMEADKSQRIAIANANALAVQGENEAKIQIAQSEAARREREAEALRRALAAEKVQAARALQDAYSAQESAEKARAAREMATMQADVLIKAEIEKQRIELEAEAAAERIRREAQGEADALFAKMQAQANGYQQIMSKQAEGFARIVQAAGGNPNAAIKLMMAEKIEEIVKVQVEAIKNLNIDKITVWDSMSGEGGSSTTSNFLSSIMKSVPPMNEVFKMAGMEMPELFGKEIEPRPQPRPMPQVAQAQPVRQSAPMPGTTTSAVTPAQIPVQVKVPQAK